MKMNTPWILEQNQWQPEVLLSMEDDWRTGNGLIGQRANFEEYISCASTPGTYMKDIFTSEKDKATDTLSALPDWTSVYIRLNAELLDINTCEVISYKHSLNLQNCLIERSFEVITPSGYHIEAIVQRFLNMADPEIAAIRFFVKSLDFEGKISFTPVIDGSYPEKIFSDREPEWNVLQSRTQKDVAHLWIQTRHSNFQVCEAMSYEFLKNNSVKNIIPTKIEKQKVAGFSFGADVKKNEYVCLNKYVSLLGSTRHPYQELTASACKKALTAREKGWNCLLEESTEAWKEKWREFSPNMNTDIETQRQEILKHFRKYCL